MQTRARLEANIEVQVGDISKRKYKKAMNSQNVPKKSRESNTSSTIQNDTMDAFEHFLDVLSDTELQTSSSTDSGSAIVDLERNGGEFRNYCIVA